ncbi:class I ribonucleotide reductase maintenance protein YfaE [Aeromonas caviae]|uniref:class I ribonucleotide reductase maintenance protein YfaE n=1 Tax=unclassified Aeromonas TaxID=257493 RepID=UPI0022E06DAB|nr:MULTISPECIES: class I ribonucleotide reductase maintenance protein YfaE [Aeromonas]MDX7598513.1 class I ribonucleotide reductase maintenance protein YfaE [Aeromonas caviae]MDX7755772.1 class I ribonucleotide reductase maintenance protein YfaE [Aeromonas caviae]MDX7775965.1 class I ribonucleotide reductase maintenance protein YfaE [Aeromonas caviae]MDX7804665.1 class I ribonucleotide reductase maintenance protein YfaE [Aeromonas caviae]MDX7866041.1 class I ribonucleotide reductase maintenanc
MNSPLHTATTAPEGQAPQVQTLDGVLHPHPGESVLETLERHGHHVEFQCRSGYCGACRTPLLAGKVHYAAVPLAFVSQGECLPCCCQPVGAIKLDIRKG